jgi:hypothetical protein
MGATMKSKFLAITATAIFIFLAINSLAQDKQPKIPFIQHDVCPFECCQFGKWTAKSLLKAHEEENDNAGIAFTIKPGEEFSALRGNVHITKLGKLVIEKPFGSFVKDDNVYVLSYRGEGFYDLWYKGKILNLDSDNLDKVWSNSSLVNYPNFTWWVLVRNKEGKQGWLRLRNITDSGFQIEEQFDGADSCS